MLIWRYEAEYTFPTCVSSAALEDFPAKVPWVTTLLKELEWQRLCSSSTATVSILTTASTHIDSVVLLDLLCQNVYNSTLCMSLLMVSLSHFLIGVKMSALMHATCISLMPSSGYGFAECFIRSTWICREDLFCLWCLLSSSHLPYWNVIDLYFWW